MLDTSDKRYEFVDGLPKTATGKIQRFMHTEWLNWLFATPDLHRTHHSVEMKEGNTNFGNNLILWDLVFRTRLTGRRPSEYGVSGVDWPETYLGHLATPFTYGRLTQALTPPSSLSAAEAR